MEWAISRSAEIKSKARVKIFFAKMFAERAADF
jgi:hypothetical protein